MFRGRSENLKIKFVWPKLILYFLSQGVRAVLEQMKSLEADVPLVKSYVSRFAACAVTGGVISLSQLAGPLHNGRHYPLFLLCLQQVHKMKDREWLVKAFNDSRLDLQKMLPGKSQFLMLWSIVQYCF